jgi:hypothetical protein
MTIANNAIVSRRAGFSPLFGGTHGSEMSGQMLAPQPRSGALWTSNSDPFCEEKDQT